MASWVPTLLSGLHSCHHEILDVEVVPGSGWLQCPCDILTLWQNQKGIAGFLVQPLTQT